MTKERSEADDVVVVGGGLAGLAAATLVARGGRRVQLFEKAPTLGGRAATHEAGGFLMNLGPHALYRRAEGASVLKDLDVAYDGGVPGASGGYAVDDGRLHALPGGFVSLLTTGLFGLGAKLQTARLLATLGKVDTDVIQSVPLARWVEDSIPRPEVRRLVLALIRLTTYTDDPARQSAGSAVAQLQLALADGVLYVNGGWQSLVDGLYGAASRAGVSVRTSSRVVALDREQQLQGVRLADGTGVRAAQVIVAGSPDVAVELIGASAPVSLRGWAESAVPVRAACLDVGLRRLPDASSLFALGIDESLYLSVHSAAARLAPEGAALVHVAKYLGEQGPADGDERQLETLLDLVQPGWREEVVERRFLPRMTVSHAVVTAESGGLAGRPGPAVAEIPNLFVVGDWVGCKGMLADASLGSAREAAQLVLTASCGRAAA